jgi:hypothetical protein
MLVNTFETALFLTERLIGFALILQTIELFQLRKTYSKNGIWTWNHLRHEFENLWLPLRVLLDWFLSDRHFLIFLVLRLILIIAGLIVVTPLLWGLILLSTILITMRWRGTFNGGSDYMSVIVLIAVLICLTTDKSPIWSALALGYVGLQCCLSYFIAGVAKLRHASWRDGTAVRGFLQSNYYGSPELIRNYHFKNLRSTQALGWVIMIFECVFPLALLNPKTCLYMISFAFGFHILNATIYGLNRFVWAWAAAYPSLYWCSQFIELRLL